MKKLSAFLAIISLSVFFIYSCQKDKSDAIYSAGESNNLKTTVTGIVLDESNAPLNGVTVTAYGQTTTTNQYGTFVLKNLNANKDRCVLQFTKAGFFNRAHGLIASANTVNYVRIVLLSNTPTQSFSAAVGGTISLPDGSSAEFQPNSIVTATGSAYTGTVNLIVKHLSPDDANFGFTIPGGDLLARDLNNKNVVLYTYGMLGVELTGSSGEALQLAAGTPATLTMAIAPSQLSSAPATIPLWYFDETTSLWKEEGTANKVGSNYVGTVAHFSWWNCDYQGPRAYIKGKVVDCNGVSLPNIIVSINGVFNMTTDQNGEFMEAFPCNMTFTVQVLMSNNPSLSQNSQLENITTLSNNQTFIVPDLHVPCPTPPTRVLGNLKTCSGANIEAIVLIRYATGVDDLHYTLDGSFDFMVLQNVPVEFIAYNINLYTHQNFTTLIGPAILDLGNILMCDPIGNIASSEIFHENFEIPDSVSSYSSNVTANAGWNLNSRLKTSGIFSDSSYITIGDTTILTTVPFSTVGYDTIILSFNHICKIDFFDKATIQVSADNGATWYQLSYEYTGSAPFNLQGNGFSAASYGIWVPGILTAVPNNLWWKTETFNLSTVLSGALFAKIRFVLYDPNSDGGNGCAGWFIDDIRVGGS